MNMYCYQCQEAAKGVACNTNIGICGKTPEVAGLQDVLMFVTKGVSILYNVRKQDGADCDHVNHFVMESLFATITNANFDNAFFLKQIRKGLEYRDKLTNKIAEMGLSVNSTFEALTWKPKSDEEIRAKAQTVGVLATENEDVRSLRELATYGLKGLAAYAEHAYNLNNKSTEIFNFLHIALEKLTDDTLTADQLVALVLETGKFGVDVMALLDSAHTTRYGNPEITSVNLGVRSNPGILISGHDLRDLEDLLNQTKGTGVDVYTHSEMLPAHYYPFFKKYDNFAGNYGNAWWKQREEFSQFNGPILFTTNCIVPPNKNANYNERVFTTGASGMVGWPHIADREEGKPKDFSAIIEMAKGCKAPNEIETGQLVGGFAHNQVGLLADKVVDAVKSGAIKKFVVMAGCDGRQAGRSYYTDFANALPQDSVVLTAGCAKYRYNKLELGDIGGIPRVLDAGQCNDSYSLVVTALKLKEAFGLDDINDLPIAYNIAWYEQKAVIVLLALLHLGVKKIHLGPTLPAFLSPNVAKVLIDTFGIAGISTVEEDMKIFELV